MKRRSLKHLTTSSFLIVFMLLPVHASWAGVAIIANLSVGVNELTADQVSDIFLGKARAFPSGEKVIPVDQGINSAIRSDFYSKVLNKSESEMKSYWSRVLFTGKGRPPLLHDGDIAVRSLVAQNPTIIGYIDSKNIDKSVKVLLLVN